MASAAQREREISWTGSSKMIKAPSLILREERGEWKDPELKK